jgi:hypothetical protein
MAHYVGLEVLIAVAMYSSAFWEIKIEICFMMFSYLVNSSNLKMEATCSSETSVDFQRTILQRPYVSV